jgi:glycosyltransferase involved in cell wall biosynthesis
MNVSDCTHPEMSIVIVTPDRYETIRRTILHLRSQKAGDLLEVVIVAPSKDELGLIESEVKDFLQCCIVEVGPIHSTAKARAAGIRQASAPVIALVEDHSYPCPGWAETLIAAHRQPWAAVGPVVCNANPESLISWTNLLVEYGPWLDPREAEAVDHLPGHNGTYKRSLLLEYGPELEAMLEAESILHWDLRAKGYQLYLEPGAKTSHLNFSSIFSSILLRFYAGRLFASTRAWHWSLFRRFFYFTSSPLIPLVRLLRITRELRRPGRPRNLLPRILPALVMGLILDGVGEMIGYAFGRGHTMEKLSDMEFHRYRYLNKQDKRTFAEQ